MNFRGCQGSSRYCIVVEESSLSDRAQVIATAVLLPVSFV
jgi:hypothetical protein